MTKAIILMAVLVAALGSQASYAGYKVFPGADLDKKQLTQWYQKYQQNKRQIPTNFTFIKL